MMTNKQRSQVITELRASIKAYSKISESRSLTRDEYQEIYFLQNRIDELYQITLDDTIGLIYDGQTDRAVKVLESIRRN